MTITAKSLGFEQIKTWFEGMCHYELPLDEDMWERVIAPLFDEIFGMEQDLKDLENRMKALEDDITGIENARDSYRKMYREAKKQNEILEAENNKLKSNPPGASPLKVVWTGDMETESASHILTPYFMAAFQKKHPLLNNIFNELEEDKKNGK